MSLVRCISENRTQRAAERIKIFQNEGLLAQDYVVSVDRKTMSIAGRGMVDLDTEEVQRALHDGSVRSERGK